MPQYNLNKRQRQIAQELVAAYEQGHEDEFWWLPTIGSVPAIQIGSTDVTAEETDLLILQSEGFVTLRRLPGGWAGSVRQRGFDAVAAGFDLPEPAANTNIVNMGNYIRSATGGSVQGTAGSRTAQHQGMDLPLPNKDQAPQVFLSYACEDLAAAQRVFQELRVSGVNVWFDRDSLRAGERWKPAIRQAIRTSRFFVALLSAWSVSKKGYVQKELREALEVLDEFPDQGIYLIPVRLDDCQPSHQALNDLHWVDMFPSWSEGLEKMLREILRDRAN